MILITIAYAVLVAFLLVLYRRAVLSGLAIAVMAIAANILFGVALGAAGVTGPIRASISGAVEELLRSASATLFKPDTVAQAAVVAIIYASLENLGTFREFAEFTTSAGGLWFSFYKLYKIVDNSTLNSIIVTTQPFARLALHFLFLLNAITFFRARRWALLFAVFATHAGVNYATASAGSENYYITAALPIVGALALTGVLWMTVGRRTLARIEPHKA